MKKKLKFAVLLKETMRSFWGNPITEDLVPGKTIVSERYRGRIDVNASACVGCFLCVRICPTGALQQHRDITERKNSYAIVVDYSRCAFCGLCEKACSRSALILTNDYVQPDADKRSMVVTLVRQ